MRKKTAILLITALVIVGLLGFGAWKGYEWFITRTTPNACYLQVAGVEEPLRLTNEQARNASIIVAESYNRGLSEQAAVIALATAWQESGLRNLNYGDRDSLSNVPPTTGVPRSRSWIRGTAPVGSTRS